MSTRPSRCEGESRRRLSSVDAALMILGSLLRTFLILGAKRPIDIDIAFRFIVIPPTSAFEK